MNFQRTAILVAAILCGAAHAQTSVTVYGRLEAVVGKSSGGTSAVPNIPAASTWRLDGLSSRLGFRGIEDLGGGLKAYFQIEHRFKPDTGLSASTTTFWEGKSIVGIAGKFGDVYLGRDYVPAFYPGVRVDPFGYDGTAGSILGLAWSGYTVNGNSRAPNMVAYKSPEFGGASFRLATSLGEGTVSNTNGANVEYAKGPAYVGIGTSRTDAGHRGTIVAAAYDFGPIRPAAWYSVSRHSNGVPGRSVALAATAPLFDGRGQAKLVYIRFDPDTDRDNLNASAARGGAVRSKIGVGYEHFLSKRTSLMASLGVGKQDLTTVTRKSAYDFGIRHNF